MFPIAGVLKQMAKDKEADMASNRYLGITEAAGSPTGEDHFFFSLEKDIYDVGIPADAIDMGDSHYEINQDACLQCGTCQANCPADAIEEQ